MERHASSDGVQVRPFEGHHTVHLHRREVVPAMLHRIVVGQTVLCQLLPWHERPKRGNRQVTPEGSRRALPRSRTRPWPRQNQRTSQLIVLNLARVAVGHHQRGSQAHHQLNLLVCSTGNIITRISSTVD